jgi:hypothetical protein
MIVETKAAFVINVYGSLFNVMKSPIASRPADQEPMLVFCRSPETHDKALIAAALPLCRIDLAIFP